MTQAQLRSLGLWDAAKQDAGVKEDCGVLAVLEGSAFADRIRKAANKRRLDRDHWKFVKL